MSITVRYRLYIFSVVRYDCKSYVLLLQKYRLTNRIIAQQKFVEFHHSQNICCHLMSLVLCQMTQNMFQEGLHQVFLKERPLPSVVSAADPTTGQLVEDRLVRWFRTVVNTRILLSGVTKIQFNCHRHPTNPIKLIT